MQDSDSSTGPSSQSAGPLAGYRVLEFGSFVAGPFAAQMLADLGADVIKIEPPTGDPWRSHMSFVPYESRVFIALNRGKRSICIDLKQPEGIEVCHALVRSADAVLSNNRPDTAAKLKFDHETLMRVNPSLVYCDITAYGASGPKKERARFRPDHAGVYRGDGHRGQGRARPSRAGQVVIIYRLLNGIRYGQRRPGRPSRARTHRRRATGQHEPARQRDRHAVAFGHSCRARAFRRPGVGGWGAQRTCRTGCLVRRAAS